ncbi:MAG: hypothetical protein JRJ00_09150 [Deltaproteobacteria bacterium]|nr:hypothetical protein [Deltaproteobacteria bacterium]
MTIGGISIILILGIINFILLLIQLGTGLHYINLPFGTHKIAGITLFVAGFLHGILAVSI